MGDGPWLILGGSVTPVDRALARLVRVPPHVILCQTRGGYPWVIETLRCTTASLG